jgi:hypothetical protein
MIGAGHWMAGGAMLMSVINPPAIGCRRLAEAGPSIRRPSAFPYLRISVFGPESIS